MMTNDGLCHHRGQYRHRVGEARCLDYQPAERDLAALATLVEVAYRHAQVAPDGATNAAALQKDDLPIEPLKQMMIEPDFAELVDKDCSIGEPRRAQQLPQQRCLAAPQKAGDHVDRDVRRLCSHGHSIRHALHPTRVLHAFDQHGIERVARPS